MYQFLKFQFAKDKNEQKNIPIKTNTLLYISIIPSVVQSKTSVYELLFSTFINKPPKRSFPSGFV